MAGVSHRCSDGLSAVQWSDAAAVGSGTGIGNDEHQLPADLGLTAMGRNADFGRVGSHFTHDGGAPAHPPMRFLASLRTRVGPVNRPA